MGKELHEDWGECVGIALIRLHVRVLLARVCTQTSIQHTYTYVPKTSHIIIYIVFNTLAYVYRRQVFHIRSG